MLTLVGPKMDLVGMREYIYREVCPSLIYKSKGILIIHYSKGWVVPFILLYIYIYMGFMLCYM